MLRNNDFGGATVTQTKKMSHFTPTDQRELYRDAVKQQSSNPFKLERVVNYDGMFTEHGSSFRFGTSHNYNPNYFPPKTFVKSGRNEPHIETTLSGPDRYKFFHRPVVGPVSENEFLSMPMNEKHTVYVTDKPLKTERDESQEEIEFQEEEIISQPRTREAGTQSMYRENDTQTMPYFPPVRQKSAKTNEVDLNNPYSNQKERAVMRPGEQVEMDPEDYPDYMKMHDLVFEDGRNGGFITEDHIKIVDRTRRRREVEEQLKRVGPNIDEQEFKNRVNMLKDLEMIEWKEREEEVAKMQERQIEHVRAKFEVREQVREMKSSSRLESRLKKIQEETKEKLAKIEKKKLKNIRRTIKKFDNPENTLERRDILFEYSFPASRTYAPMLRDGQVSALTTIAYEIRPALLTDPLGVEEVQMNQVNKYLTSENRNLDKALPIRDKSGAVVVDPLKTTINPENRKQKVVKEHLQLAIKELEKLKNVNDIHDRVKEVKEMYKSTPRITRPPTPTLEDEGSETDVVFDDLENAASFIQKLLRGRAAQEEFYEGKERSIELIKELQAVEEIKRKEREQEKSHHFKEQQRRQNLDQAREIVMDNIQGKLISNALDFLSKELIRQDELKRVKQLVEFAEKERHQREQEEIIRRKHEEEARKRKEKIQSETIQIHTDTVSTYLLDIFNACSESLAERQAREEILQERLSDEILKERTVITPEEGAIKDLVKSFLLPQVKREVLKKKIDVNQNKFLNSAHSLFQSIE
ncbi:hypothetical protein NAEGRDRAFT_46605 [Naegleria gruberi]|uniref:Cilia- and flagella-associated protein 91 n=1 Tax=Naegleria gruberi TaxID=5762 RepID=D2V4E0_NAEGR|nr:uncharacterized protein NAEGRDRAFT_46605 [Naegleria gruberi]EFC48370.1 hypothetical protein NAEGRDRAFT_46605 [Naegleria gruberi]|eukprot:XP_002681114.1 hypothetical protein NAEGRDRAFT_46605 [Naegleria gruberi strain NEG-M]